MIIFFLGPTQSTFVKNDINILRTKHELIIENSSFGRRFKGLWNLIKLTFRSIRNVAKADAVYCWFADYATFIPSLLARSLGKKVFVVAGGFDARYLPEINYGARAKPIRWFCVKNTFRFATKIFPVSKATEISLHNLTHGKHGVSNVIYNGLDVSKFLKNLSPEIERNIILTISQADTKLESDLKGIDKFIEIGKKISDREFVIAGLRGSALNLAKSTSKGYENIRIIPGPLDLYTELIPLYQTASAYCQLSIDETFGVAVVESMLCGAMPIVTSVGGLPEIVNKKKYIVKNDKKIIKLIKRSFEMDEENRKKFSRYATRFNIDNRKKKLLKSIDECWLDSQ